MLIYQISMLILYRYENKHAYFPVISKISMLIPYVRIGSCYNSAMKRNFATFEGRDCRRCGSTTRYVATKRCVPCQQGYVARSFALRERRSAEIGKPCGICTIPMTQPHLDEDPQTGEDRGWLCQSCNLLLGHANDDPAVLAAAVAYLGQW